MQDDFHLVAPASLTNQMYCACAVRSQLSRPSIFLRRLRGEQCVVYFHCATRGRPGADALPIALEGGTLFDHTELQAPSDLRADVDIRGGEAAAHNVAALRDCTLEGIHGVAVSSITDRSLAPLRHCHTERLVYHRGFERTGGKEHPTIVR